MSLAGRSVLVTGGTGTFGHAFTAYALAHGVRRLVIYSRDEFKQAQMKAVCDDPRLRFFIGDVRDPDRLALALTGVEDVIHAAALKRIEVCEAEPIEAVATNILGTQYVAVAAIRAGVERAVLLSTDKAAAPVTLYGATKLAAERLWVQANAYAAGRTTALTATRYGNVLGSRGSVVDHWKRLPESQPLTVTDPNATRFWMRIGDAVDLVLLALEARAGDVLIPKVVAAKMADLAVAVGPERGWKETGLRVGEKLHEVLFTDEESRRVYDRGSHYVLTPNLEEWTDSAVLGHDGLRVEGAYRSDQHLMGVDELRRLLT